MRVFDRGEGLLTQTRPGATREKTLTSTLPPGGAAGGDLQALRRRLLAWFRTNQRDLPWRSRAARRDPYRVWVSEVMLQQTRVTAALPYYKRFLRRFPTLCALAQARRDAVLKHWAGLGYYNRARNLHRAAREILRRHGGSFPREHKVVLALPGIGRYTAAAVLSIAYDAPLAVLDGNVARVLARLGAVRGNLRAPRRWEQLERTAQQLLVPASPGEWNQALMELGATLCTPRAPRCAECPISRWCRAYALGIAGELPSPRTKRSRVKVGIAAAILLDSAGRTLLVRQNRGLFSGMWQFPALEVDGDGQAELARHLRVGMGIFQPSRGKELLAEKGQKDAEDTEKDRLVAVGPVKHTVTFRQITLLPYLLCLPSLPNLPGARVVRLEALGRLPVSSATRKIAVAAANTLQKTGAGRRGERRATMLESAKGHAGFDQHCR